MKQVLFFLFLLMLASPSRAQQLLGFQAGYSLSNVHSNATVQLVERRYRVGLQAKLLYEYLLKKHFYLGAGFSYAQLGFRVEEKAYDPFTNSTVKYTSKEDYDYTSMPMRAGYRRGTKRYFFAGTGLVPALLVKAQATVPLFTNAGIYLGNAKVNIDEDVKPFDLGWMLEAGAGIELNSRFRLQVSLAYQQSISSIRAPDHISGFKARHRSLTTALGLRYQIPRKQMDN